MQQSFFPPARLRSIHQIRWLHEWGAITWPGQRRGQHYPFQQRSIFMLRESRWAIRNTKLSHKARVLMLLVWTASRALHSHLYIIKLCQTKECAEKAIRLPTASPPPFAHKSPCPCIMGKKKKGVRSYQGPHTCNKISEKYIHENTRSTWSY